jgi:hypothetical protein
MDTENPLSSSGIPAWFPNLPPPEHGIDGVGFLDTELRALDQLVRLSHEQDAAVEETQAAVAQALSYLNRANQAPPVVTGDRLVGLALPRSPIEILIPIPDHSGPVELDAKVRWKRPSVLQEYQRTLHQISIGVAENSNFTPFTQLIRFGVPHLISVHRPSGLTVDISCEPAQSASTEYIKQYLQQWPELRPLYFALRLLLEGRQLFGRERSAIQPYALQLMVVATLKLFMHEHTSRPDRLGQLLMQFLDTFGTGFDYRATGVSVEPPEFFTIQSVNRARSSGKPLPHVLGQRALLQVKVRATAKGEEALANQLCIQDPSNYLTNAGFGCTRTPEIVHVFSSARRRMVGRLATWQPPREGITTWNEQDSILRLVILRAHELLRPETPQTPPADAGSAP